MSSLGTGNAPLLGSTPCQLSTPRFETTPHPPTLETPPTPEPSNTTLSLVIIHIWDTKIGTMKHNHTAYHRTDKKQCIIKFTP